MHRMLQAAQTLVTLNLLAACSLPRGGAPTDGREKLHYRPLNGRSLQELAQAKAHHGKTRFYNPFSDVERSNFLRVLRWKFLSPNEHSAHYKDERVQQVSIDWPSIRQGRNLSVTLIRHAGIMIKDQDSYLLIDPVFGKIFWFIEDFSPLAGDLREMPPIDLLLITHGHYDHVDIDSLSRLDRKTRVLLPLGYDDIFDELGMTDRRHLDWFDRYQGDGREIIFLPCNHWTMRNPLVGPNTGLWGSYLIRTRSGANIFIAGDTAYFDGFAEIGRLHDIDLAIFNLGAYEPRWFMAASHMNPEETYRAFRELGARHMLLAHWGTFRLGNEPVHFPPHDMAQVIAANGASGKLLTLGHGETLVYG